ncbi:hypothetical protein GCM10027417_27600 [Glutamicibacter endophyticus]
MVIRAISEMSDIVELRIVGQGTEESALKSLASDLGVPVDFRPSVYGRSVLDNYEWADTCLVSLRPDWKSFDHTIPSKLYELMYLNQHITGLVKGEAADIISTAEAGSVVPQNQKALSAYFWQLYLDRSLMQTSGSGRKWVEDHASLRSLGDRYLAELLKLVEPSLGIHDK